MEKPDIIIVGSGNFDVIRKIALLGLDVNIQVISPEQAKKIGIPIPPQQPKIVLQDLLPEPIKFAETKPIHKPKRKKFKRK